MALPNMHITCGYVGAKGVRRVGPSLMAKIAWSEAPASNVATASVAPATSDEGGPPAFQFAAGTADCYIAIGPNPDASQNRRAVVRANTTETFYAEPGDKAAWIAA